MANDASIAQLVEDLSGNLDDLESSLGPLLQQSLSTSTSRLPLLDKAKVYVLATYAIESLLFSYLRLNGVDAKEHAVFRELTRVKAYFEKIKLAEAGPEKRTSTLDKDAAARFVKHGLAGNAQYDRQREAAKRKAQEMDKTAEWGSANRFASTAKRMRAQEDAQMVTVVKAAAIDEAEESPKSDKQARAEKKAAKLLRRQQAALSKQSPASDQAIAQNVEEDDEESTPAHGQDSGALAQPDAMDTLSDKVHKRKKKRKSRGEIRQKLEDRRADEMS